MWKRAIERIELNIVNSCCDDVHIFCAMPPSSSFHQSITVYANGEWCFYIIFSSFQPASNGNHMQIIFFFCISYQHTWKIPLRFDGNVKPCFVIHLLISKFMKIHILLLNARCANAKKSSPFSFFSLSVFEWKWNKFHWINNTMFSQIIKFDDMHGKWKQQCVLITTKSIWEISEQLHIVVETIACNMRFSGISNNNNFSSKEIANNKQDTQRFALKLWNL